MKKYTAPVAEKINFDYKNQVVASSAAGDEKAPKCRPITPMSFAIAPCYDTPDGDTFMNN